MRASLIVCDREGRLARALRREGALRSSRHLLSMRECRSLAECDRHLEEQPASLAAVDASAARLGPTLEWLVRLERDHPAARAVLLCQGLPAAARWALREAGALAVESSILDVSLLAQLAAEHLGRQAARENSLRERVWSRLPWQRSAG